MNRPVFNALCTPQARNIVRQVFRERQDFIALDNHDIYETVLQLHPVDPNAEPKKVYSEAPPGGKFRKGWQLPPQPLNHPVRSVKFLKTVVLENMAEGGELEKVIVRRSTLRDEDGRHQQVLKSKTAGFIQVPPEKRHPKLLREKESWLWWYTGGPERLNQDEPEYGHAENAVNLKLHFGRDADPDFDPHLKFIDVGALPNEPRKRRGKH